MTSATERLTRLVDVEDRYDYNIADVLPVQIEAANERFASRLGAIKLLANRAETAGISEIRGLPDLVPLLFAHTAYKSYPENWLTEGRWDRIGRWLESVSSHRVEGLDISGVTDIDDWLNRLAGVGHYLSCSSGTTGKVSMINSSMADRVFNRRTNVASFQWSTGLRPDQSSKFFACNPTSNNFRNSDVTGSLAEAFGAGQSEYKFPGGMITIGQIRQMVALRRSIADGAARPTDIAEYEATTKARENNMNAAVEQIAEALVENRSHKLLIIGMFPLLFRVAETIRSHGYSGKDFHPANALAVGGGLKRSALPDDYREQIFSTLNIHHTYHMYAMQELNTQLVRCAAGRYHIAPWVLFLPLDEPGEQLLQPGKGEMEARAAFFDLSHDGRWGGVITGDKVQVDHGKCACGRPGPTLATEIIRYADLASGDKISCAGTIDAYVRGLA